MNSEQNSGKDAVVAALPRGANGIPEPEDLAAPDFGSGEDAAAGSRRRRAALTPVPAQPRVPAGLPFAEWIAATAVVGGALAAIVGCSRELTARSRRHTAGAWDAEPEPTKPNGDKLLPHGQRHW